MSILTPPKSLPALAEPLWLPTPECPDLPIDELHIWRMRMEEPRWRAEEDDCPVTRNRVERAQMSVFRQNVLEHYAGGLPGVVSGPGAALRVVIAQCDHLALMAVSRNVRDVGLDVERVRADIPFEEMADGFLDAGSQWDLRITWSLQEKAWKFFQFWTSNEACAQAQPSASSGHCCHVRRFSPEAEFVAALAIKGGPEAEVIHWEWQASLSEPIHYCSHTPE